MSAIISADAQLTCFLFCTLFGVGGGIFALLYFLKCRFLERILVDLFATLGIGGLFIATVEYAMDGQVRLYGVVGYIVGLFLTIFARNIIKKIKNKHHGK